MDKLQLHSQYCVVMPDKSNYVTSTMNEWTISVLGVCIFLRFVFVNDVDCYLCNYRVMKTFFVQM